MNTKSIILALVTALVMASAMGEEAHVFNWMPNANLPADVVELSPEHLVQTGEFYLKAPDKRPADIPPTFVLVWVYQGQPGGVRFVGRQYMDADFVNALHGTVVGL
jgi:hypothetical protein